MKKVKNFEIANVQNHPPNVIKQIPKTVEKRLFQLFSNEKIFK